jgi:tetratricopeptide (TPR) repeat protein
VPKLVRALILAAAGLSGALAGFALFVRDEPAAARRDAPLAAVEQEPGGGRTAIVAARELERAVPAADARWSQLNNEAIEALESGKLDRAIELFEQCHRAVPGEPAFKANLAEALTRLSSEEYARGGGEDRARAVEHLARAVELAPQRIELAARLAELQRFERAEQGFWTDLSEHFELAYDGDRDELLWSSHQIVQILEHAYLTFGELFGHFPVEDGRPRIRVVLYRRAGFHEVTGIGHWAGGLFDGTVRVPVEDLGREKSELERVLRHEIVHAFAHASGGPGVPGWLNEGLAQWLESSSLERQSAQVRAARERLRERPPGSLDELPQVLGSLPEPDQIARAYAQALAFTAYVERAFGDRVLFEMVAGCRSSTPCEETFRARTGAELESAFRDFASEL